MRSEKLLHKWYEQARQELVSIGFPYVDVPIKLNGRLIKSVGRSWQGVDIELNKEYFLYESNEEDIKDTIMHELCHQLADETESHGRMWWDVVKYVNKNLGYEITEKVARKLDWKYHSPKYVVCICDKCDKELRPFKLIDKSKIRNYYHEGCGGSLSIIEGE